MKGKQCVHCNQGGKMQIGKTNKNTYFFRVFYADPLTNEQKRKYSSGYSGKKEAIRACNEFLSSLHVENSSTDMKPQRFTFEAIVDDYISHVRVYLQETSLRNNQRIIDKYIHPTFKGKFIDQITKLDLRQWMDSIYQINKSVKYKNDILRMMRVIFSHAQEYFNIEHNPTDVLKTIKRSKSTTSQVKVWEISEFNKFISTFNTHDFYEFTFSVFFTFLYWTGLRRGEAKALRFSDFDFKNSRVRINKSATNKITGKGLVIQYPKTESSIRVIDVDRVTMSLIKKLRNIRNQYDDYSEDSYVFVRRGNHLMPLADTTIESRKNRAVQLAGIKNIRIHDFRHSHASVMIANNIDLPVISRRMGHSSIDMTIKVYTHILPSSSEAAKNKLNSIRTENDF